MEPALAAFPIYQVVEVKCVCCALLLPSAFEMALRRASCASTHARSSAARGKQTGK
jgi:hypothetical protein